MKKAISLATWLLLSACRQGNMPVAADIVQYAEQERSGLRKNITAGRWLYTIQYKPAGYILQQEGVINDSAERSRRREQLGGMAWFNISFRVRDFPQSPLRYQISSMEEYNSRLHYFLNEAAQDICLLYGADTLYAAGYGFDNKYNLTPYETMVIGFPLPPGNEQPVKDMQLVMYDRVFRNGIIKATIHKEHLAAIAHFDSVTSIAY